MAKNRKSKSDDGPFLNRELSWIEFNFRVLEQAEDAGLPPLEMNETNYQLLLDGLVAYSGSLDYGSPVLLQFDGFDEVKASGLQMTRSPGKTVVYIGSVLLVIGILFMFYVRELRVWVLIGPTGHTRLSMSSNRKNSDLDRDFNRYRDDISQR